MKLKIIVLTTSFLLFFCGLSKAQDNQEKEVFTSKDFVKNWQDKVEGYGIKPPVTKLGEWLTYVVNAKHNNVDSLKVTRITLIKIENDKHTVKLEEWYHNDPDKILKKDVEVKPYKYPLPWKYPIRCYREKIKGDYKLKVGNKELPVKREILIFKTDHVYLYKIYKSETLPFGAPVKLTWIGPLNKRGDRLNSIKMRTNNFRSIF